MYVVYLQTIHLNDYLGDVDGLKNRVEALTNSRRPSHLNPSGEPLFSKALEFVKDRSFQVNYLEETNHVFCIYNLQQDANLSCVTSSL